MKYDIRDCQCVAVFEKEKDKKKDEKDNASLVVIKCLLSKSQWN